MAPASRAGPREALRWKFGLSSMSATIFIANLPANLLVVSVLYIYRNFAEGGGGGGGSIV